jgi:hypothetical protein
MAAHGQLPPFPGHMRVEMRNISCVVAWVLVLALVSASQAGAEAKPVPLDPDVKKDLALLGDGVVGKALPAPPLDDLADYLNLGSGQWHYEIVHGGKAGNKVRTETYAAAESPQKGGKAWKRVIGDEYVEYLRVHPDGKVSKYAEDDLSVGYGANLVPGVLVHPGLKVGETFSIESELEAFKAGHPDDIKYRGKVTTNLTYLGVFEVTTPAGTFPAILIRNDFDVDVGPATVSDTMYSFFAKGVGKVAELETQTISALLVYHSKSKIGKLLADWSKD